MGAIIGKGWENKGGISISVKKEEIIKTDEDEYGNIRIFVGKRSEVDEHSKATHYVKLEDKRRR